MLLSLQVCGVFVGLLGVAYYAEIHHVAYFVVVQIFVGIFEVSLLYNTHAINTHIPMGTKRGWQA